MKPAFVGLPVYRWDIDVCEAILVVVLVSELIPAFARAKVR